MIDQVVVYTREEAAEVLKVGTRTVDRLLAARALPHSKVGKQIRITPADIESFLANTHVKSDMELAAEVKAVELRMRSGRQTG